MRRSGAWQLGAGKRLELHRPVVVAILNVTPDSFSDGGQLGSPEAAARAAARALAEGAAMLDVGGESTRPGAARVDAREQIARVVPALRAIRAAVGDAAPISVDTTLAEVAEAALDTGADAINDVSAGEEDPAILTLAARRGCGVILMHRRLPPGADSYSDRYVEPPRYADVVTEVRAYLRARLDAATAAGIAPECVALDPGLGFGKTVEQNLALIRGTPVLAELGRPIVSGVSRKSFCARAANMGEGTAPGDRLAGTLGLSMAHAASGATLLRVHDVSPHVRALEALFRPIPAEQRLA